jgi:4'-phosphopantetheinyl transferase
MNSVRLYYIKILPESEPPSVSDVQFSGWMDELSPQKRSAVQRLIHFDDRLTSMLGLRLLRKCALDEGISDFTLSDVVYPERGKPYWCPKSKGHQSSTSEDFFDFNISHTQGLVVVAISRTLRLGVDAEKARPLKRLSFKMVMSEQELTAIEKTPERFFEIWSKKEAVVKAANTAGLARMRDVILGANDGYDSALLDDGVWYLKSMTERLGFGESYAVFLATEKPVEKVTVKAVSIGDLLN